MIDIDTPSHVSRMDPHHRTATTGAPRVDVDTVVYTPVDRVRWGPVLAGLFGTLACLAVLTTLGLAIGFSSVDANDRASDFGWGAGIWSIVAVLLSFAFGGWLAARSAAVGGGSNGLLQGAMVWMVTIGLLIYLIAGGVGAMFRTAGSVAQTTAQTAGNVAPAVSQQADPNAVDNVVDQAQGALNNATQQLQNVATPQNIEEAAGRAATGTWGTLISMLLGLGAACAGGLLGARTPDPRGTVTAATT